MRWLEGIPIVPINYYKSRFPMAKKASMNLYTPNGRIELQKATLINKEILHYIMRNLIKNKSIEYNDNQISLYALQIGRCAITGKELQIGEMECYHKKPIYLRRKDNFRNLIFVTVDVYKLIHVTKETTISTYLRTLKLDKKQLEKLNKLRVMAGLEEVAS